MTLTSPPEGATELTRRIEELRDALQVVSANLVQCDETVLRPEHRALAEAKHLLDQVRACVRLAIETETRFDNRTRTQAGCTRATALDLEGARASIRCRLDRLRTCRGAGGFPGQSE